ncbi:hypothetical protein LOTGIDRAFT_176616 [Lottia gigantea]|uniref:Chitin-binding type-2 domain-containing protein n=1 Tax=Lottia gigantea TaxID=225164 RepID=V3ZXI9_LOTGI|nr:hypothetical protein LOTGIDRAFT_176616 [Lottia gigantea]ESO96258.1 hypothetical protein LOTGIDRAFT_176616 [Lottia gigantea]
MSLLSLLICHIVSHIECINSCSVDTALGIYAICGSCVDYVTCIGATGILQTCTGGLIFDSVVGSCNTVERGVCGGCSVDTALGIYAICGSCVDYVTCIGATAIPQTCTGGLIFDSVGGSCNTVERGVCGGIPTSPVTSPVTSPPNPVCISSCTDTSATGIFAICGSCVDYIICANGLSLPQTCTGELIFDSVTGTCTTVEGGVCGGYASFT